MLIAAIHAAMQSEFRKRGSKLSKFDWHTILFYNNNYLKNRLFGLIKIVI